MEQQIVEHMREQFNPLSIIIHGSRAVGRERPHSDWDFFLLYDDARELPKNGRLIWNDQNIEFTHHQLPIKNIEDEFGVKLQFGRLVYDENGEGAELVARAKEHYSQPAGWSETDDYNHRLWMKGRVDGMRDTLDQPLIFERYASDFYARITNYWYWAIHDSFPKPIYLALEEIAEKDPGHLALIEQFVEETDRTKRFEAAEEIKRRCFG
ncbi:MAG: nucleotidyltransferase domain-containing protein [Patescibacteria group bacterium]